MHLINAQYRIMDIFEKTPFQNLMLASCIDSPDDIVVINEIVWTPLFTRFTAALTANALINLRYRSEDDSSFQIVTPYHRGIPLETYLSGHNPPFANRINLCYGMLKDISHYSPLPAWIQDILIDEDQIVVWENRLFFNELVILKTDSADYPASVTFLSIRVKLHCLLGRLMGPVENATPSLVSFMERLKDPGHLGCGTLQDIFNEFQKVYLYDYYLDQTAEPSSVSAEHVETVFYCDEPATEAVCAAPVAVTTDDATEPSSAQEPPAVEGALVCSDSVFPLLQEVDPVDADMEKNLELFFNRKPSLSDATEAEFPAEPAIKKRIWPWLVAGAIVLTVLLWVASDWLFPLYFSKNLPI